MIRFILIFFALITFNSLNAQTAAQKLYKTFQAFEAIRSFKCKTHVEFDIPSINIDSMSGTAFYKAPDRFRIKFSGIAFLPKDNPFGMYQMMKDTTAYVAVLMGKETVQNQMCDIISILPVSDEDLISAKFWISQSNMCPLRTQITTKSNGTIKVESVFGSYSRYALPDKSTFYVDMKKFKVPKMLAVDVNSKRKTAADNNEKTEGKVEFYFKKYELNAQVSDEVFQK